MDPIRTGIIGCGRISSSHADALRQLCGSFELTALADPDEDRRGDLARRHEVANTFAGARDLCSHTGVDAVIICSPNEFHAEQAILALNAGKHVLVEKPMADNAGDAAKMADAARRAGRVLALGHTFRHCRAIRYVQDHLQNFGPLRAAEVSMCVNWDGPQTRWWAGRSMEEGLILSLFAPHALDFVQLVMQDAFLRVHVEAARHQSGWRGEDEAMILLSYPGRRMASVHVSYNQDYVVDRKSLHFEDAFVLVEDNEKVWVNDELVVSPPEQPRGSLREMGARDLTPYFVDQLKEFANAIHGRPHRCILAEEGVQFTAMLDQVLRAATATSRTAVDWA